MNEKLSTVITMLFILSMISERVVTFIKLHCIKGKAFLFIVVPAEIDTCKKYDNPEDEARRARSILAINLLVGFIIAIAAKANLFEMFKYQTGAEIEFMGWDFTKDFDPAQIVPTIIGCALTGLFISMGSKFWHDVLDLLMKTKDLKGKLVDKETYKNHNLKQLDEFIETNYYELAQKCLTDNIKKIESLTGIKMYYIGLPADLSDTKPVIILHSSLPGNGGYPSAFTTRLSSGKEYSINTEIYYNFLAPLIQLTSGSNIYEGKHAQFNGSICCNVRKGKKNYALTCAHVLTGGSSVVNQSHADGWFSKPKTDDVKSRDNKREPIGTWQFGQINDILDVALVEMKTDVKPIKNSITTVETYTDNHIRKEIFLNGNINMAKGFISGYVKSETEFIYNGNTHKLKELILITKDAFGKPEGISSKGDSGALVYLTKSNAAIGMVVGGNSDYTYVIPMDRILKTTQTSLT